ncbi:MAG TPA: hypothetical protein VF548_10050 [Allosphingosinicella sp.]|jgi:hypothetical protein
MKPSAAVLASTLIASAAVAQAMVGDIENQFSTAFEQARRELLVGNYLTAVALVRPFALTESGEIKDDGAFQVWDQMQAMVSGAPSLLKQDLDDPPDRQAGALVAGAATKDALQAIVIAARRTRVVMLNENHRTPCQRIFAARLAQALRPLGYNTLAMEALATSPATVAGELKRRGYPVLADGFYIRDPAYGFFVRRSLKLGYTPLAYEADPPDRSDPDAFQSRERGQAAKLWAYLRAHPQAKLLVYGGGGHLAERPLADGSKMMGQWFREMSGVDPLTIDQNRLQSGTALRRDLIKQPVSSDSMLFRGSAPLVVGSIAGRVDMQVVPMSADLSNGRPDCLLGGGRHSVKVRMGARSKDELLLQAFAKSDRSDAVPLDQAIVRFDRPAPALLLPPTSVRLISRRN